MTKSRDLGNLVKTGAVQFPDGLGTAGQALQVNSGATGLEFADASGSGITTYTGISGTDGSPSANDTYLANVSSPSTGDMAYVVNETRVYIYTASGVWFTIAEISNVTPTAITHSVTHSGGSATSYNSTDEVDLAGVTTAVTVALTSTDPEGFPLTWAHNASGTGVAESGGYITLDGTNAAALSYSDSGGNRTYTLTPQQGAAGTVTLNFSATETNGTGTATSNLLFSIGIQYPVLNTLTGSVSSASISEPSQANDYYCTPEGDFSFVSGAYGPQIFEHTTHKNPSTTQRVSSFPSSTTNGGYWAITASQDGTRIYAVEHYASMLRFMQWNYNLGTTTPNQNGNGVSGTVGSSSCTFSVTKSRPSNFNTFDPRGMAISKAGTKVFIVGTNSNYIFRWHLSTAFDITSIGSSPDQTVAIDGSQPYSDVQLSPDDKYIIYRKGNFSSTYIQREFSSSNPLSLSHTSAVTGGSKNFSSSGSSSANVDPLGACFLNDGNSMFVFDRQNDQIDKYTT